MSIENLTLGEIKQIQQMGVCNTTPKTAYEVGKSYLIRTVTFSYTGRIKKIYPKEIVLEDAAWIADTGRFHNTLKLGTSSLDEIEPYVNDTILNKDSIVDATEWVGDLPREQK